MGSPLILLAEEDPASREFLARELAADGYEVMQAENRRHALALLSAADPVLVLADLNGETLGLLDAIRTGAGAGASVDSDTPIIVLSHQADEIHRIRVLERGGDDVIPKPVSYPELRARVGALLRRAECRAHPRQLRIGTLKVDLGSREVHVRGRPVALTAKEFGLLAALAREPTRVRTSDELLREVWRYPGDCRTRTVQSHAYRLRHKLSEAGAEQPFVVTVWGVGIRLTDHAWDGVTG